MSPATQLIDELRGRVAASSARPDVVAVAPGLAARIRFRCESESFDVVLANERADVQSSKNPASIEISASPSAWLAALATLPEPGFQSFTAWQIKNPAFTVSGDAITIAQSRAFLEVLVENFRPPTIGRKATSQRSMEAITGRYRHVTYASGQSIAVYTESAGMGRPVLCLHTAGADSRQYHGLMTDTELLTQWQLLAFDMPFHGRSLPPPDWSGARYSLDQTGYRDLCVAFIEQIVGTPVVLIGCSMGAAIAMVLAADRPDLVQGLIALEAPVRPRGRRNPYLTHVAVHGGLQASAYVRGLMSPLSPLEHRTAAAFIYSQGAPGVYEGDLMFYSDEFDGEEVANRIDGQRVPSYFLTGRYDYSATIEDAQRLSSLIPGAKMIEMPELGHFPMTEAPERFRTYLLPVLNAISEKVG